MMDLALGVAACLVNVAKVDAQTGSTLYKFPALLLPESEMNQQNKHTCLDFVC
jgi:hypothetical protein